MVHYQFHLLCIHPLDIIFIAILAYFSHYWSLTYVLVGLEFSYTPTDNVNT